LDHYWLSFALADRLTLKNPILPLEAVGRTGRGPRPLAGGAVIARRFGMRQVDYLVLLYSREAGPHFVIAQDDLLAQRTVPVTALLFATRAVALCSQRQTHRIAPLSDLPMEGQRDRQARVITGLNSKTRRADPSDPLQATMVALHLEIAVDAQLVLQAQNDDKFAQGMRVVQNVPRTVSTDGVKQKVLYKGEN